MKGNGNCLSGGMNYKKVQGSFAQMSKFASYSRYKTSGIEWLKEIPAHWDVKRLKNIASLRVSKFGIKPDDSIYVGLEHIESWTGRLLLQNQPVNVESVVGQFRAGDVLFGKLRPYLAKAARPNFDGVSTSEIIALQPGPSYCQSYMMYCLLNEAYIGWIDTLTYGARMPRVSPEQICTSVVPFPPLAEQRAIAAFLDRETAKLDALIEKKERLIALLQEKRTALISRVVTQGLNPSVCIKPSGIVWLKEIPAHWEVKRLKYLVTINDEVLAETTDPSLEIAYVDIGSVDAVEGITDTETLVFGDAPSRARRIVRQGDVIISTVRTYLKAIARIETVQAGLIVSTGFAVIRPKKLDDRFVAYVLKAPYFVESVVAHSVGVGYPAINTNILIGLNIAHPPLLEQRVIAAFLDRELAKLDALVSKVRDAIEQLQELRTALISVAVTGQIDIRIGETHGPA